ncbi:probable UDP-3-O-acylglucosamine N-acyltransferase 2, mitochondrial isoform X2 [Andrographis paniculata]|uniref:probable UDP-3-O-acylglucosamine N-acyltransferase 2, mitochondrial isoform X2 n=1 Tax=Andrographis paniculata TaxID=175694 RepID=UPI0021E82861|nr:probable UDP-3-O-acylglucosamine N-acyltransferase 2, mitochondrial isoform X2 [Andrographis paniculata]
MTMALRIAKLATSLGVKNRPVIFFSRPMSSLSTGQKLLDENATTKDQEFQKWWNGGGMFHQSALIDPTAQIEFGAVVHSEAIIGANACIGSGSVVGPSVTIGHSTRTGYKVVLSNCTIGDSCIIHHGVCIGQDGFGFFVDENGLMVKKPQSLRARIGNHVEIGANTCIDRGSWRDTVIGEHTKIDNLVQIGHNVEIGNNCMICGQVGIAGSATIGNYVTLGGRVSIRDHVSIASKVRLAGNSCVTKNISEAGDYGGFPAVPIQEWRKQVVSLRQISKGSQPSTHSSQFDKLQSSTDATPEPPKMTVHSEL